MRKLILQMQMSVDGYVASAQDVDWQIWGWGGDWPWDDRLKADFNAIFRSIDCILLSRKMAEEGYLTHWGNTAASHPGEPDYDFARRIVEVDKVVASRSLQRSAWERTSVARGELADTLPALKRKPGKDIITFGGIGFARSLLAEDLVDELQLFVNPFALGDGFSIFQADRPRPLKLIQSTSYDCGMVVGRYQCVRGA